MNLAGVRKVLDLEARISRLEAENERLRAELEEREAEHGRMLQEVHRSYRREVMLLPRGELVRRETTRRGAPQSRADDRDVSEGDERA